jgi:hypothetical protein
MKPIDLDAGYVASLTIEGAARPSLVGSGARRAAARKCRLNLAFVLLHPLQRRERLRRGCRRRRVSVEK